MIARGRVAAISAGVVVAGGAAAAVAFAAPLTLVVSAPATAVCAEPTTSDGLAYQSVCSFTVPQPTAATVTAPGATVTVAGPTVTVTASSTAPAPTPTASSTTATVTPSPTVPPSDGRNCYRLPSACGYPDETNTGPDPTVHLVRVAGNVTLDKPNTTYCGYEVIGTITITAANVTVCNTSVYAGGTNVNGITLMRTAGAKIDRVRIYAPTTTGPNRLYVGIKSYDGSDAPMITRSNISGTSTAIQVAAGTIEDNYIHDLGCDTAGCSGKGDHVNGTTSNGPGSAWMYITHNTVFNQYGQTDAISLFEDFGKQSRATITGNFVSGGGYTIYGGANAGGLKTNDIVITNNRFGRQFYPRGGSYGPYTAFDPTGSGNRWAGNYWDDTGATIN